MEGFDGTVRLFPLPNFVMFPAVVKGLHIFEPRYCALLQESLSTDRLIAMALLRPGWEANYYKHPAIHDVVCIGQVTHLASTPDGKHNILLSGLKRAKIVREHSTVVECFRRADVVVLDDVELSNDSGAAVVYRSRLLSAFRSFSPAAQLFSLLPEKSLLDLPLRLLVDLIAQELPLSLFEKQELLSELVVQRRCDTVLRFLGFHVVLAERSPNASGTDTGQDDDSYPPKISWN